MISLGVGYTLQRDCDESKGGGSIGVGLPTINLAQPEMKLLILIINSL